MTNEPEAVLDAWTALEVLSPQPFRPPEDRRALAWLDREHLPWEGNGEKARPKTKLFYQIVLGTVDLEAAVRQLLTRYTDSRIERPAARGEAILAIVMVDREGRLVEAPAISISSFAWGVPRALRDDLTVLADWRAAEEPLTRGLGEVLRRGDDDDDRPLDRTTIMAGWEWLVTNLGLPRDLVSPPRFAVRCFEYFKSGEPPDPLLLNSFFLKDLGLAKGLFCEGKATPNLRRYLGSEAPLDRHDLLADTNALEAAVAPDRTPPARWPSPGRHPLVLLQQAAVNLAFHELGESGILAVNGPPGTGKTTLLRDLVARIITARAEAMAELDDPATAFAHSGERLKAGDNSWLHLYRLDGRLKDFEMLVASSNNKAVENVSAELPELKAIATDAEGLRYFKTLADELFQCETWGLVAAVLGNAKNRNRFKNTFWWDKDVGLSSYLAEAAGTPQLIELIDSETGARSTRPPRIVEKDRPPKSHEEALRRWRQARAAFRAALDKSRKNLEELAKLRVTIASLPGLARDEVATDAAAVNAQRAEVGARETAESARFRLTSAQSELLEIEGKLIEHARTAPGLFARLFSTRRAREWRATRAPLLEVCERARKDHALASAAFSEAEKRLREAASQRQAAESRRSMACNRHTAARRDVAAARERGCCLIDEDFFAPGHSDRHKASPWLSSEQQRARDDVFVAAMVLHKAFVDAAAKPLRHNLGALMNVFGGRILPTLEKRALIPDLWSSLFLVVPLVSTTFASVERMLGNCRRKALAGYS